MNIHHGGAMVDIKCQPILLLFCHNPLRRCHKEVNMAGLWLSTMDRHPQLETLLESQDGVIPYTPTRDPFNIRVNLAMRRRVANEFMMAYRVCLVSLCPVQDLHKTKNWRILDEGN